MEECFNCGILETKTILFDAISPEGIAKICGKCSAKENIPVIKNGFSFQNEKKQTVHERLSKISGVSLEKKNDDKKKQETSLRNIVDFNFKENFKNDLNSKKDLIDNFHWVVMRARRSKKLTQEQFAETIHEPVKAIQLIEKGFVPEKKEIIDKLEDYLRIRIKKNNEKTEEEVNFLDVSSKLEQNKEVEKTELVDFDFENVKNLTIADLQEMKKKREDEIL